MTVPSFLKAGRRPETPSIVAPARIYSSWSTIVSPLRVLTVTGGDLVPEPALGAGRLGLVLAGDGEIVLVGAGHLILLGQILGGDAHMIAVEDVGEAVLDHRVDEADVAHLGAAAQMLGVGGKAHALLAAGDDDGRVAGLDRLAGERDRAQARAADLVDAPGRHLLGNAGGHRGLAGRILALGGGQHLAEDHFGDVFGRDSGLRERGLDRDPAELVGGGGGEGAEEGADGGALGGGDDDVGHG